MPFEHDLFCSFDCKNKEEDKMTDIKGVLLIPEEGDPHGLLKERRHGARPPIACWDGERWRSWTDNGWWWPSVPDLCALVVAWDGESVRGGCYRVADAKCNNYAPSFVHNAVACTLPVDDDGYFERVLEMLSSEGTIVLIDAEGREIKNK
jgi:hypothetical protein